MTKGDTTESVDVEEIKNRKKENKTTEALKDISFPSLQLLLRVVEKRCIALNGEKFNLKMINSSKGE